MMAAAQSEQDAQLKGIASRHPALVRRLEKFYFPSVALPLAGLLTLPATHPANLRLTALIHLAAMYCRGDRDPTLAQLREWLNEILLKDPIAQREDPVEDVCVSNVVTWFGNARLFEGGWQENDFALDSFLAAGMRLREDWMKSVLRSATALLKLSEAVATRRRASLYALQATTSTTYLHCPEHRRCCEKPLLFHLRRTSGNGN
jgi:hypothetical protein